MCLFCCQSEDLSGQDSDLQKQKAEKAALAKLRKHPLYDSFAKGEFVVTGLIENYKFAGSRDQGDGTKLSFHSIAFQPKDQIRGNYFSITDASMKAAKRTKPENWTVSAGLTTTDKIAKQLTQKGEACIFVLKTIKSSSMAGNVPIHIVAAFPATKENLAVAKAAAADKK